MVRPSVLQAAAFLKTKIMEVQKKIILVKEEPRCASELIEVPIANAAAGRVAFPDNQQLRSLINQNIIIKKIRLITAKVLTNAPTLGTATTPLADLKKLTATFYCEGWEKGHNIPVLELNDFADGDSTAATTIPYRNNPPTFDDWRNLDWSKSFVTFANGTTASIASALMFDVEYVKLDAQGNEIKGAS